MDTNINQLLTFNNPKSSINAISTTKKAVKNELWRQFINIKEKKNFSDDIY